MYDVSFIFSPSSETIEPPCEPEINQRSKLEINLNEKVNYVKPGGNVWIGSIHTSRQ